MAAFNAYCTVLLLLFSLHQTKAVNVEITVPVQPVIVGGILPVECKIWNMESEHEIRIYRSTKTHTEQLTFGKYIKMGSSLEQRIFLATRDSMSDVSVYFLTLLDVSLLDEGTYLCYVYGLSGLEHVKVTEGSVDVTVNYLPSKIYPQCQSTPSSLLNMNENTPLKLTCVSEKGSPAVQLRWIDNLNKEIQSRNIISEDTVTIEATIHVSKRYGTMFICEMTSAGFQDFQRSCQVGPVTTRSVTNLKNTAVVQQSNPNFVKPTREPRQDIIMSKDCNRTCQDNKYTILYLGMATVCAAILTIVFFIATIIMCLKYSKASSEIRNAERIITNVDRSEPVYVSLQTRQELERRSLYAETEKNSIYADSGRRSLYAETHTRPLPKESDKSSVFMSVEDPNNPGSKVLVPKEVFEEFYNSLSLKRK